MSTPASAGPNLLGVDVGFSKRGKSTGLAWRISGELGACLTGTGWAARLASLPTGVKFDIAALDAPLVPDGPNVSPRGCEAVFYRGAFAKRCRPGMSHFGHGLLFRAAGAEAAEQFASVLQPGFTPAASALRGIPMVEAFPNAFMGVLLDNPVTPGRVGKSDRLYAACLSTGIFERLVERLGWSVAETVPQFADEKDHDIRAAYVCLMTAAFGHAGNAAIIGDDLGGWLWLPPYDLWAGWAREALELTIAKAREKGHPKVAIYRCGST